jgi:hypothetical protein
MPRPINQRITYQAAASIDLSEIPESEISAVFAGLTQKQREALGLLAEGRSVADVGAELGIEQSTIYAIANRREGRLILAFLSQVKWDEFKRKILNAAPFAISLTLATLHDEDAPRRDRLKAAEVILKVVSDPNLRPFLNTSPDAIDRQIEAGF